MGLSECCYYLLSRPYLTAGKRELLADYSLPVAVIIMAFIGAFAFKDVDGEPCTFAPGLCPFNKFQLTSSLYYLFIVECFKIQTLAVCIFFFYVEE